MGSWDALRDRVADAYAELDSSDEGRVRLAEEASAPETATAVLQAVEILHTLAALNADVVGRLGPREGDPANKLARHLVAAVTPLFDFATENVAAVDAQAEGTT